MPGDSNESDQDNEIFFFPDETIQYRRQDRQNSQSKLSSSNLRRSISLTDSQHSVDMEPSAKTIQQPISEDSVIVSTEMRDILYFDNSMMSLKTAMETDVTEALPQVATELGTIGRPYPVKSIPRRISSDTEDEFCFIAHEEKPQCMYEEVETTTDPIQIVDSHFNPPGKQDPLKPPEDFPMAVMRYTICEMTITWQLYDGNDFPKSSDKPKQLAAESTATYEPRQMSEAYERGVAHSKGSSSMSHGHKSQRKLTWKERGGANRCHDTVMKFHINKVRFSHETYPARNKKLVASRQVLLVTELEILDRIKSSDFNKFLYHNLSGLQSKKNSQHMLVVKATHVLPDASLPRQECELFISVFTVDFEY